MQSGAWPTAHAYLQQGSRAKHGPGPIHAASFAGRPPTPTRGQHFSPLGGVQAVRSQSPAHPGAWPQVSTSTATRAWHQGCVGSSNHAPRYPSPSPAVSGAVPRMDSQALHRKGYTTGQSPQRRPSPGPSHHHYQVRAASPAQIRETKPDSLSPINLQAQPNLAAHKPIPQKNPRPTEPVTTQSRPAALNLLQTSLAQDQVTYYKNQVQDLKHAIQAHACSMGVEVSSIMDRSIMDHSNLASDNLLLQETRLQIMRDRARAKSAESALMHARSNLSALFEAAQGKQDRMLGRAQEACVAKLEHVSEAIERSRTRLSILSAMLPAQSRAGSDQGILNIEKTSAVGKARKAAPPAVLSFEKSQEGHRLPASPSKSSRDRQQIVAKFPQGDLSTGNGTLELVREASQDKWAPPAPPRPRSVEQTDQSWKERLESMHLDVVGDGERARQSAGQSIAVNATEAPRSSSPARESMGILLQDGLSCNVPLVKFVTPNSAAFRAGIRKGDALVSVNNEGVGGMPLEQVCNLLSSPDSETFTLGIADACASTGFLSNSRPIFLNLSRGRRQAGGGGRLQFLGNSESISSGGMNGKVPLPRTPQSINLIPESLRSYQEVNLTASQPWSRWQTREPAAMSVKPDASSGSAFMPGSAGSQQLSWNETHVAFM